MSNKGSKLHRNVRRNSFPPDLADPVIAHLVDTSLVSNEQVWRAYRKRRVMHQLGSTQPAWRLLAADPAIDRDRIYAVAAEVHEYRAIETNIDQLKAYVQQVAWHFSESQWRRMSMLGLIPVGQIRRPHGSTAWIFASYDPTQPEAHRAARAASCGMYEMRFAPHALIATLITEVFLARVRRPSEPEQ